MERRSGKDRRQYVDPRYQSSAYPGFVDRRKGGDRRKLDYQHMPGHPVRKWIFSIGVIVVVFLISLFFILSVALTQKSTHKTFRKKTIKRCQPNAKTPVLMITLGTHRLILPPSAQTPVVGGADHPRFSMGT
ncbi:MAG: hypothetical protein JRJ47_14695 [Deltaproteobacteria bacterium]|nr:hypothetical protein [Deltaproteobacteria bacterium]